MIDAGYVGALSAPLRSMEQIVEHSLELAAISRQTGVPSRQAARPKSSTCSHGLTCRGIQWTTGEFGTTWRSQAVCDPRAGSEASIRKQRQADSVAPRSVEHQNGRAERVHRRSPRILLSCGR